MEAERILATYSFSEKVVYNVKEIKLLSQNPDSRFSLLTAVRYFT